MRKLNPLDSRNWPLGHMVIAKVRGERIKGQHVERVSVTRVCLRLRDNTYLECGTHMLAPPTGLVWPYEKDDVMRALPGSWDRRVVKAHREGKPEPEFKPWIKPKEKPVAELPGLTEAERAKEDKRERARQRRLARKARGGKR